MDFTNNLPVAPLFGSFKRNKLDETQQWKFKEIMQSVFDELIGLSDVGMSYRPASRGLPGTMLEPGGPSLKQSWAGPLRVTK